jgi:hypothetical protein
MDPSAQRANCSPGAEERLARWADQHIACSFRSRGFARGLGERLGLQPGQMIRLPTLPPDPNHTAEITPYRPELAL